MPQRILLVDDHRLVRAGIRALLEKMPSVEVVGEADDGRRAFELIRRYRPDIVLMDIAMPNLNGLEAVDRIKKESPETKVIILSMHANEEYVVRALRSDVSGYLIKDAAVDELEQAIRTVTRGETYLSQRISKRVIRDYLANTDRLRGPLEQLTSRQREVLQLIAEGKNTKEIADLLRVSVKTVEAHRLQLMQRLDIHGIPGLVRYAIRVGLVSAEA
ncbi:MAG: response regulator [Chthoniobacterales bacterium]